MSLARPAAGGESCFAGFFFYIFIEKTSCVIYWKRKNNCDSRVPERAAKGCLKRKSGWNDSMTRCGQSATFCGIFQCWCCLPGHICILQFDWALFKGSCRMDCAEACPLPDQEGCHPMKHCQPPWRRQSEPEISSEFRVQLRSEDPGRFSGAGSVAFSGWRPAMRKACCPQRAGKKRADGSFYGGPMYVMEQLLHNRLLAVLFFRLYRAGGAVRRKRCAGAFLDSGNFSQASGVCTLDRHRSGAFGGQHPDRRSEKKRRRFVPAWFR